MKSSKLIVILSLVVIGCHSQNSADSFSFDEADYVLKNTMYGPDSSKVGELYLNKENPKLTLRKIFWENKSLKSASFFLGNRPFGPMRLYDTLGKIFADTTIFTPGDTSKTVYDKERKLLRRKS